MPTEKEIKATYKAIHDDLSYRYYTLHEMPKGEFDQLHGQNWEAMRQKLIAEGYIAIPKPPRNLAAEIDELKARLKALEPKEL